ncbi:MAG: alpha/beta fold hydrolase [Deltaproteobacteria bacterium]|nr:alpha/beta fold hydrolase [Deltaproteobacteria bacterium]
MTTRKFTPHPLIPQGYAQTFFAAVSPPLSSVKPSVTEWVGLSDGDELRLDIHQPAVDDPVKPLILLLHGSGGSGDDALIVRQAQVFSRVGYTTVRFHHRGCGGGSLERVTSLYHAGRLSDIVETLRYFEKRWPGRRCLVVGYSLSGNMILRLLGDAASYPVSTVTAALAICPPIELETSSRALASWRNRPFDSVLTLRFVKQAQMVEARKPGSLRRDLPLVLTHRQLDQVYNCKVAGFADRSDYYDAYSAKRYLAAINQPVTILTAADDPIIPVSMFKSGMPRNVRLRIEERGGHCAFIGSKPTEFGDRRWVSSFVSDWVASIIRK